MELNALLTKLAEDHNLNIFNSDVMKHLALGFDREQNKILVVQQPQASTTVWFTIDIDHVKTHFIKKSYKKINANDLKRGILEECLEKITLFIECSNSKHPVELVFYNNTDHNIFEVTEMEQIAKDWEIIISRSLLHRTKYNSSRTNYNSQYWQGH